MAQPAPEGSRGVRSSGSRVTAPAGAAGAVETATRWLPAPWGWVTVTAARDGLVAVALGTSRAAVPRASTAAGSQVPPAARRLARRATGAVAAYLDGQAALPELPLRWQQVPSFARRTYRTLAAVPPGQTITYGALARLLGRPGGARAVGRAMARNPWPLVIPCHRVVSVHGLGGYGPGPRIKAWLLAHESTWPDGKV